MAGVEGGEKLFEVERRRVINSAHWVRRFAAAIDKAITLKRNLIAGEVFFREGRIVSFNVDDLITG